MRSQARGAALAIVFILTAGVLVLPWLAPSSAPGPGPSAGLVRGSAVSFTASMTASPSQASANANVTFTVTFVNTGNQTSAAVWVNDTLPSGLAYLSDTAASAGSSTAFPRFTLVSVGPGTHSFQVVASVNVGLAPGTVLTNLASLAYIDGGGVAQSGPAVQASVIVGLAEKQLHLRPTLPPLALIGNLTPDAPTGGLITTFLLQKGGPAADFYLDVPFALSFRALNLSAVLYVDSIKGNAINLVLNLTLYDWNGVSLVQVATTQRTVQTNNVADYQRLDYPFGALDYTFPAGHQVRLQIRNLGSSSDDALLAVNATNADSRVDVVTTTYVDVGTPQLRDARGPAAVWSPNDSLGIRATVTDPFGRREIQGATINVTDPTGAAVFRVANMTVIANASASQTFETTVAPILVEGTYRIEITATEKNGVTDLWEGSALVRAPHFTLEKVASVAQARQNTRFTYTIWFNNTGTGPAARVWVNDTPPSQVTFLSSPNTTVAPGVPTWYFTNVGVGAHWVSFDVRVTGSLSQVAFILNTVSLNYSDEKGFLWPMLLATRDVIINGPVVSVSLTSAPAALVHSNETVVYSISLANSGDPAQTIWLNDTLPADLTYVSDTHNPAWGSATVLANEIDFTFTGMPSGAVWSFTLTARAAANLVRGAVLTNVIGLNDTSTNGILMPARIATVGLTVAQPWVTAAALAFPGPTATPRDVLTLRIDVANAGNEPVRTAWINLTLDPDLSFVDAAVPATVSGSSVALVASNLPVGPSSVFLNVSVGASAADLQVLTVNGSLAYVDGAANPQPSVVVPPSTIQVALPRLALATSPGALVLEAGTSAAVRVTLSNVGSGTAADAWVNVTLPGSFVFISDDSDGVRTVVGSMYSWHWQGLAPGVKTYTLNLEVSGTTPDRSSASLLFTGEATDRNGRPQPAVASAVPTNFVAPAIHLTLSQDAEVSPPGGTVAYTLVVRNDGSTVARYVNVTDELNGRLEMLSYVSPETGAMAGQTLSWNLTNLQPGEERTITLYVRVKDGTAPRSLIANTIEARYANSVGTPVGYVRSQSVFLTVQADLIPIGVILLGGAALGAVVVFLVYRRNRVQIEEVFLVYRDGILLSHLSRTMVQDKDRDTLSGMLTAVQDFVRDAFTYGAHRELHQIEFGDYHILIEQGKHAYLAVVYRGRDSNAIRRRVRTALDLVEKSYGRVLEKWDGSMEDVVGTRDILRDRLLSSRLFRIPPKAA